MTNDDVVDAIAADLQAEPEHRVKNMRYFTFVNLANACASDEEIEVYRQGLIKLLNSLSHNPDALQIDAVDEGKTIVKFNLDDLSWTTEDWEKLVSVYPYAVQPDVKLFDFIKETTGTNLAYIRADWMAFAASRPPLYNTLLKLPTTFGDLQKEVKLDIKANLTKFLAKRAGFQVSGVSRNNRLIERHGIETGYFWTSYDFGGNKGKQSLFEHPLGPDGEDAFKHDGGETVISLPNGFHVYYLNNAKGEQLNTGPTNIVQDTTQQGSRGHERHLLHGLPRPGHPQGQGRDTHPCRERQELLEGGQGRRDSALSDDRRDGSRHRRGREELPRRHGAGRPQSGPEIRWHRNDQRPLQAIRAGRDLKLAAAEFGLSGEELVSRLEGAGGEISASSGGSSRA